MSLSMYKSYFDFMSDDGLFGYSIEQDYNTNTSINTSVDSDVDWIIEVHYLGEAANYYMIDAVQSGTEVQWVAKNQHSDFLLTEEPGFISSDDGDGDTDTWSIQGANLDPSMGLVKINYSDSSMSDSMDPTDPSSSAYDPMHGDSFDPTDPSSSAYDPMYGDSFDPTDPSSSAYDPMYGDSFDPTDPSSSAYDPMYGDEFAPPGPQASNVPDGSSGKAIYLEANTYFEELQSGTNPDASFRPATMYDVAGITKGASEATLEMMDYQFASSNASGDVTTFNWAQEYLGQESFMALGVLDDARDGTVIQQSIFGTGTIIPSGQSMIIDQNDGNGLTVVSENGMINSLYEPSNATLIGEFRGISASDTWSLDVNFDIGMNSIYSGTDAAKNLTSINGETISTAPTTYVDIDTTISKDVAGNISFQA
ncbi:hypothetical protein N9E51_00180, partial [Alphaproteobacteria bacterium]|nr:hypothetical protein [Alphaproteobacteria bacterium]